MTTAAVVISASVLSLYAIYAFARYIMPPGTGRPISFAVWLRGWGELLVVGVRYVVGYSCLALSLLFATVASKALGDIEDFDGWRVPPQRPYS